VVIGLALVLAVVGYLVTRGPGSTPAEGCSVTGAHGMSVTLDLDQASHAATIAAVAHAHGLPQRAVTIALATAIQESKLRNIDYGDRDSLGLFQQRPSQGWGSPAQIRDPVYASGKFFTALIRVPDYLSLPVTVAAQKVQRSGYPEAYAQHEDTGALLATALTGHEGAALSCTVNGVGAVNPGRPSDTAVTDAVRREFGPGLVPAHSAAGVTYRTTDRATGWMLALWMVCHATELHITSVTFDNHQWSSTASSHGWIHHDSPHGQTSEVDITLARPEK